MRPLRLAVDLRALVGQPTGIGVYTRSLLLELCRLGGFEIHGLSHRPVAGATELEAAGVRLATRPAPLGVLWQQMFLPGMARRIAADVLWSPLITLPLRQTVPSVVTVHDLTALLLPETHQLKVRWSVYPFLGRTMDSAAAVIAISESTARDIRRQFPDAAGRLHVIYPGLDPEFRPASAPDIERTRQELRCPRGYLLWTGALEPRKNVSTLVAAWENLRRDDGATPPLVLVGGEGWRSGTVRGEIARLAAAYPGEIHALGRLDRARQVRIIQAASLFAFPSLYEGFGFPPLEAMACGVPVVVSNTSSLPEVVGPAGIAVEPRDPAALAAALRRLLDEPAGDASARRERGLAHASTFRWADSARRLAALLRAAAETKTGERGP